MDKEQESLAEMLELFKIAELPPANNPERIWTKGIAKVQRRSGHYDYVAVRHNMFSWKEVDIIKEYPGLGGIYTLVEIYPIEYLNAENVPLVKSKEQLAFHISKKMGENYNKVLKANKDVLKKMFLNIYIKEQNAFDPIKIKKKKNNGESRRSKEAGTGEEGIVEE